MATKPSDNKGNRSGTLVPNQRDAPQSRRPYEIAQDKAIPGITSKQPFTAPTRPPVKPKP